MHAGSGGQVPGDDERRDDVMYDERRHRDQLSGGDQLRGGVVHVFCRAGFVLELPWLQHVSDTVHELLL